MSEPKQRPALDFGGLDDEPAKHTRIDPETIKEVSRAAGFHETAKSIADAPVKRRAKRKRSPRVIPFSVRLDQLTYDRIYDTAEAENLTIGEVIERAMTALTANQR